MNKNLKIGLIVAAVAVAGYLVWRWYQNRQSTGYPATGLGTNLNSIAPELIGGSSGPQVGPAVSMPLNITLSEPAADPGDNENDEDMEGSHHHRRHPIHRQRHSAGAIPYEPLTPPSNGSPEPFDQRRIPDDGGTGMPDDADAEPYSPAGQGAS